MQIANAVRFISGGAAAQVTHVVRNQKGLQVEKECAAYYLEGPDAGVVSEPWNPGRTQPGSGAPGGQYGKTGLWHRNV